MAEDFFQVAKSRLSFEEQQLLEELTAKMEHALSKRLEAFKEEILHRHKDKSKREKKEQRSHKIVSQWLDSLNHLDEEEDHKPKPRSKSKPQGKHGKQGKFSDHSMAKEDTCDESFRKEMFNIFTKFHPRIMHCSLSKDVRLGTGLEMDNIKHPLTLKDYGEEKQKENVKNQECLSKPQPKPTLGQSETLVISTHKLSTYVCSNTGLNLISTAKEVEHLSGYTTKPIVQTIKEEDHEETEQSQVKPKDNSNKKSVTELAHAEPLKDVKCIQKQWKGVISSLLIKEEPPDSSKKFYSHGITFLDTSEVHVDPKELLGRYNSETGIDKADFVPSLVGKADLRTNLFEEREYDVILGSFKQRAKDGALDMHVAELVDGLVAEKEHREGDKRMEASLIQSLMKLEESLNKSTSSMVYNLRGTQDCTLFPKLGFVPMGFPSLVFNEAILSTTLPKRETKELRRIKLWFTREEWAEFKSKPRKKTKAHILKPKTPPRSLISWPHCSFVISLVFLLFKLCFV